MEDINKYLLMKEHGKYYDIRNSDGSFVRYMMGQILLEFTLLDLHDVVNIITSYKNLLSTVTAESLNNALNSLNNIFCAKYLFAQAKLLNLFLSNFIDDYLHDGIRSVDERYFEHIQFSTLNNSTIHKDSVQYVFQLAIYVIQILQNEAKDICQKVISDNTSSTWYEEVPLIRKAPAMEMRYLLPDPETGKTLFSEFIYINNIEALLLLEIKNILSNNIELRYCNLCGRPFIAKRRDALYCKYPSIDYPNQLCSAVAANTKAAKERQNNAARELYRKLYNRLKRAADRHKEVPEYQNRVLEFAYEYKDWKSKLSRGLATEDDILQWLRRIDNKQSDNSTTMDLF